MIGIDLVEIDRFKNVKDSLIKKIFSSKEIRQAKAGNFYQKIAGKWAAKEAAYKAGLKYANKEMEILNIDNVPNIFVNNKRQLCMLSISHEKEYAIAVVYKND